MNDATMTIADARARHRGAYIEVIDRAGADGAGRPALYVWASEADSVDDDGARALAIYWLADSACAPRVTA